MNLTNHFILAMPALDDPNFAETITYICAHSEEGAMGIVINRPLELELGEVLEQLELAPRDASIGAQSVYEGGPVHRDRGFVLHRPHGDFSSTIEVTSDIAVATSRDILEAMAEGRGPEEAIVALGYAGWGAGQLEDELAANSWLTLPATTDILFGTPPELRWQRAAEALGVNLATLSQEAGHA